uniref:Uncharacterized protein LOC111102402 n=1 Tax=Crassostrea virginica TaxID=6565 RepID=A0A8B8AH37_CRAVI|nr:uncharacterized protein LOC111102402 [Crassostrea virginica]
MKCYIIIMYITYMYQMEHVSAQSCPESLATKRYVKSCPMSKSAWNAAAEVMNCSAVKQSCASLDKFVYHCLPNSYQNRLIEVCAIPTPITFPVCAEYNEGGNIVTENHFTDCQNYNPPCPNRYHSTEAYKYSECYVSQQSVTSTTNNPTLLPENASTRYKTELGMDTTTPRSFPTSSDAQHAQLFLSAIVSACVCFPVLSIFLLLGVYSRSVKERPTEEALRMV